MTDIIINFLERRAYPTVWIVTGGVLFWVLLVSLTLSLL
jgi:hypothetical protein